MDLIKENIHRICEELAEGHNFFVIDLIVRGDQRKRIIEVFVDGDNVVSAENLSQLSQEINEEVEKNNIIDGSYRLDVSSPGVDRPLKYLRQFPKHINRNFEVKYKSGEEITKIKAKLKSVNQDELTFQLGSKDLIIKFNDLLEAKVLISFS